MRPERWAGPAVGAATGLATGATGVFVIPAVPYLGSLGLGAGLRSRTDGRWATEVAIAAGALNRMLDLGRPDYVRVA